MANRNLLRLAVKKFCHAENLDTVTDIAGKHGCTIRVSANTSKLSSLLKFIVLSFGYSSMHGIIPHLHWMVILGFSEFICRCYHAKKAVAKMIFQISQTTTSHQTVHSFSRKCSTFSHPRKETRKPPTPNEACAFAPSNRDH